MTTGAIYSLRTGIISNTISPPLNDPDQITALSIQGMAHMQVPDGTDGVNSMVDIATGKLITINPPPVVPSLFVQYVAAQINAGNISSSAFHPATLADLNVALSDANMAAVSTPSK